MAERQQVGRDYVLREEVGRGAVAVVYRATRRSGGPAVAAKQLRPELAGDHRVRDLLLREEAALRDLRHESIVAMHDLVAEGGSLTLLTEYVDGPNLRRHLAAHGGSLPVAEAAAVGAQAAAALAAAHAQGIVHLDVKPENLLVVRDSNPPVVKLGDFGVAAVLHDAGQTVLGHTPGYCAPELESGGTPTTSADVYALGVLVAELVTGVRPGPDDEVDGLPSTLRGIIAACLASEPRDRPSARVVAAHLRRISFAAPERPPAVRTEPTRIRALLRQRAAVALAGTAVLAVTVYIGFDVSREPHRPQLAQPSAAASAGTTGAAARPTPIETVVVARPVTEVRVTFAAHLEIGTLYVAVRDGRGIAYLCDGDDVEVWFQGPARAGELVLSSKAGATLTGTFRAGRATGTITLGGRTTTFRLPSVQKPSGLYRAAGRVRNAQVRGGWIVLADGTQTGVLTVGDDPRPAPALDTTTRTAVEGDAVIRATPVDAETGEGF